ncbi:hypothetical protein B9479_008338 [Cryptococcus floricola]|uniref:Uncharacterized protein n=1 Tax=Cryptococcus floricola TaxID=2591691 RepID=A0A5D3AM97_9TREE|nr:hypothetical protein B9479_008338 [Cryptococcus floricola]
MSSQDNVNDQRSEFTSSAVGTTAASTSAVTSQQAVSLGRMIASRTVTIDSTHPTATNQERSHLLFGMVEDALKEANIKGDFKITTRVGADAETIGMQHVEGDGGAQRTEEGEQAASASAQSGTWTGDGVAAATVRSFDPSTRHVVVEEVEDEEFEKGKKNEGSGES